MIDVHRLIGEVAARDGIRVDPGDPAFALVTLNQLVLEDAVQQIGQHIHAGIAEFTDAVHKSEDRAGRVLAAEVKAAAAELRLELQPDIETARVEAKKVVDEVHRAHGRAGLFSWGVVALVCAAVIFGSGLWIGAQYLR